MAKGGRRATPVCHVDEGVYVLSLIKAGVIATPVLISGANR